MEYGTRLVIYLPRIPPAETGDRTGRQVNHEPSEQQRQQFEESEYRIFVHDSRRSSINEKEKRTIGTAVAVLGAQQHIFNREQTPNTNVYQNPNVRVEDSTMRSIIK